MKRGKVIFTIIRMLSPLLFLGCGAFHYALRCMENGEMECARRNFYQASTPIQETDNCPALYGYLYTAYFLGEKEKERIASLKEDFPTKTYSKMEGFIGLLKTLEADKPFYDRYQELIKSGRCTPEKVIKKIKIEDAEEKYLSLIEEVQKEINRLKEKVLIQSKSFYQRRKKEIFAHLAKEEEEMATTKFLELEGIIRGVKEEDRFAKYLLSLRKKLAVLITENFYVRIFRMLEDGETEKAVNHYKDLESILNKINGLEYVKKRLEDLKLSMGFRLMELGNRKVAELLLKNDFSGAKDTISFTISSLTFLQVKDFFKDDIVELQNFWVNVSKQIYCKNISTFLKGGLKGVAYFFYYSLNNLLSETEGNHLCAGIDNSVFEEEKRRLLRKYGLRIFLMAPADIRDIVEEEINKYSPELSLTEQYENRKRVRISFKKFHSIKRIESRDRYKIVYFDTNLGGLVDQAPPSGTYSDCKYKLESNYFEREKEKLRKQMEESREYLEEGGVWGVLGAIGAVASVGGRVGVEVEEANCKSAVKKYNEIYTVISSSLRVLNYQKEHWAKEFSGVLQIYLDDEMVKEQPIEDRMEDVAVKILSGEPYHAEKCAPYVNFYILQDVIEERGLYDAELCKSVSPHEVSFPTNKEILRKKAEEVLPEVIKEIYSLLSPVNKLKENLTKNPTPNDFQEYLMALYAFTKDESYITRMKDLLNNYKVFKVQDDLKTFQMLKSREKQVVEKGLPKLTFSSFQIIDEDRDGIYEGGEKISIKFSIMNQGTGSAKGVVLKIEGGEYIGFKDKKIGLIRPKELKRETFEHLLPEKVSGEKNLIIFARDVRGIETERVKKTIVFSPFENPKLNFQVVLTKEGNKNSRIDPGEEVSIEMYIINKGGDLRDATVEAVFPPDIILQSPNLFSFRSIEKNDSVKVEMSFVVPQSYAEGHKEFPVTLKIGGRGFKDIIQKKIPLGEVVYAQAPPQFKMKERKRTITFYSPVDRWVVKFKQPLKEKEAVALIIGIEDYAEMPPSRFSDNDAVLFYNFLKKVMGVKDVKILLNEEATYLKIKSALKDIKELATGKTVYLYFSGHGYPKNEKPAIVPYDASQNAVEESLIFLSEMVRTIKGGNPEQVVVIADACFSGLSREGKFITPSARPLVVVKEENYLSKTIVLTATSPKGKSYAFEDKYHGAFTYSLIASVRFMVEKKGLKSIKASALYRVLEAYFKKLRGRKGFHDQLPQLYAESEEEVVF